MEGGNPIRAEVFGPYFVYEKLGAGGMATVHRATQRGIEGFERDVALKRLLPHVAADEAAVKAFVREAKLAAMLKHPSIAQVYDLGRVGDVYYIAMEHVEGYSVLELLRCAHVTGVPLPTNVVLAILIELCDALEYAHTRVHDLTGEPLGIVHRDVSPSNLIVTFQGVLKMIDFGIAMAMPDVLGARSRRIEGKFGYMAPEALRGDPPDARSDIFSAGVVAHELLTARRLFKGGSQAAASTSRGEVAPPSAWNPLIPPELDDAVLAAMTEDPAERWATAGAMRDAFHAVAVVRGYLASSDQIAEWLHATFGDPATLFGPTGRDPELGWLRDTDVDSFHQITTPTSTEHTPTSA